MKHHTKDKGDIAVAVVIADLTKCGFGVCLPLSEHMPFDLIAVNSDSRLSKVQVKYRSQKDGCLVIGLRSIYADKHGSHAKPVDRTTFDAYAVYCPENDTVYYIRNDEIPDNARNSFKLRLTKTQNNQAQYVNPADHFIGAERLFETGPRNSEDRIVAF